MWVDWNYHCVDHPQTTPDNSWGAFAYGNSNILGWILLSEFKSWIINRIFRSLAVSLSYDSRPTIQLQYSSGPLSLICITPQNYPILLTKLEIFYQVDNLHLPPPYLLGGAGGGGKTPPPYLLSKQYRSISWSCCSLLNCTAFHPLTLQVLNSISYI